MAVLLKMLQTDDGWNIPDNTEEIFRFCLEQPDGIARTLMPWFLRGKKATLIFDGMSHARVYVNGQRLLLAHGYNFYVDANLIRKLG